MMNYYQEQHKFIQNIVENMNLADYKTGIVVNINPVKIKFDDMKPPIEDVGTNMFYDERYVIQVQGTQQYMPNLQVGDKLLLLKVGDGQKFIIMSKLYSMTGG